MSASGHTGAVAGNRGGFIGSAFCMGSSHFKFSGEWVLPAAMSGVKVGRKQTFRHGRFFRAAAKMSERLSGCGGIMRGPGRASPSGGIESASCVAGELMKGGNRRAFAEQEKGVQQAPDAQRESRCLCGFRGLRWFYGCGLLLLRGRFRLPRGKLGCDGLTHLGNIHAMPFGCGGECVRLVRPG